MKPFYPPLINFLQINVSSFRRIIYFPFQLKMFTVNLNPVSLHTLAAHGRIPSEGSRASMGRRSGTRGVASQGSHTGGDARANSMQTRDRFLGNTSLGAPRHAAPRRARNEAIGPKVGVATRE